MLLFCIRTLLCIKYVSLANHFHDYVIKEDEMGEAGNARDRKDK